MSRYLFLVMANAVAGREEELDRWYDDVHLKEMLAVPCVRRARRYKPAGHASNGQAAFLTLYEVECEDVAQAQAELLEHGARFHMSDAFDHASATVVWYEPLGPPIDSA